MLRNASLYFLYAYSFCAINAVFMGYGLGENILIYKNLVWSFLPTLLIVALILLTKPYSIIIETILYINATVWSLLTVSQAVLFQSVLDAPSIYIILTTTGDEIGGFFDLFLNFKMVLISAIIILLPLPLWYLARKKASVIPPFKLRFAFLLLSVLLLFLPAYHKGMLFVGLESRGLRASNIDWNIRKLFYIQYATYVPEALLLGKLETYTPENVVSTYNGKQNIVIIVMESSFRNNFSLYGYPRKTNPQLEKFDFIQYDDILSPSPVTSHSLPHMYTFSNLQNSSQITTIHDIFKVAGFETHYFRKGDNKVNYNDIIHLIADRAENIHRLGDYDSEILNKALEIIETSTAEKKLFVIETTAAHFPYHNTYPKDFEEFKDNPPHLYPNAEIVRRNQYDTAILYLDSIISKFMTAISEEENTIVLITSDHGNEVGYYSATYGHSNSSKFLYCFEIPLFLWTSEDYKKSLENLVFDPTRAYQNDNLIHSIIDLAHIQTPLFKPELSLFNKEYTPQVRYIQGLEYEKYKEEVNKERDLIMKK